MEPAPDDLLAQRDRLQKSLANIIEKQTGYRAGSTYLRVLTLGSVPGILGATLMDAAHLIRIAPNAVDRRRSLFGACPKTIRFANAISCGLLTTVIVGFALDQLLEQTLHAREQTATTRLNRIESILRKSGPNQATAVMRGEEAGRIS